MTKLIFFLLFPVVFTVYHSHSRLSHLHHSQSLTFHHPAAFMNTSRVLVNDFTIKKALLLGALFIAAFVFVLSLAPVVVLCSLLPLSIASLLFFRFPWYVLLYAFQVYETLCQWPMIVAEQHRPEAVTVAERHHVQETMMVPCTNQHVQKTMKNLRSLLSMRITHWQLCVPRRSRNFGINGIAEEGSLLMFTIDEGQMRVWSNSQQKLYFTCTEVYRKLLFDVPLVKSLDVCIDEAYIDSIEIPNSVSDFEIRYVRPSKGVFDIIGNHEYLNNLVVVSDVWSNKLKIRITGIMEISRFLVNCCAKELTVEILDSEEVDEIVFLWDERSESFFIENNCELSKITFANSCPSSSYMRKEAKRIVLRRFVDPDKQLPKETIIETFNEYGITVYE